MPFFDFVFGILRQRNGLIYCTVPKHLIQLTKIMFYECKLFSLREVKIWAAMITWYIQLSLVCLWFIKRLSNGKRIRNTLYCAAIIMLCRKLINVPFSW